MSRKKIRLKYKKERVLFSDVLPYELPIIMSNRNFYRLLVRYGIHTEGEDLCWNADTPKEVLSLLKLYLGKDIENPLSGKQSVSKKKTIPFVYNILHKPTKTRQLAIVHPLNQIEMVEFYEQYKSLLLYYCSRSNFSIRYPQAVASYFYYRDRLHNELLGRKSDPVEMFFSEYENLRTYFSYKEYTNIYKFYESYRYQRAEKKYSHLVKFDVQACFDSIYTHSITWAINGGPSLYKDSFVGPDLSFGEKWDRLMENMNYGETNGIVIGPEFSRLFAEVILQFVDSRVEARLKKDGYINKSAYECYRYVDDHFLFYNDEEVKKKALSYYEEELKAFKIEIKYAYFTRTIPGEAYRKGKELIESGIDALITMPVIPQEFLDLMPELESIPYVFVDTPLGGTQPLLTIAQNPYRGGYCAGKIMKLIRGSGTYACIRMFQSAYNLRERVRGFSDFFANDSGSKTFDTVCPESTEPGIYAFMDNLFKENPDITGVFVPHAEVYLVGNYIVNAGLKDKVTVIGYDLMDKNKAGIKDGNIDCVIGQRPINQGSDAVYKLYQSGILHQEIPEQIDIPIDIFFKENII